MKSHIPRSLVDMDIVRSKSASDSTIRDNYDFGVGTARGGRVVDRGGDKYDI